MSAAQILDLIIRPDLEDSRDRLRAARVACLDALRVRDGQTYRELAESTGLPTKTVSEAVFRHPSYFRGPGRMHHRHTAQRAMDKVYLHPHLHLVAP
jgi:hypothetical protein